MKRVIIVLAIILAILGICAYSLYRVKEVNDQVHAFTDAVFAAIQAEDQEQTIQLVQSFSSYWREEEAVLAHFVRHAHVDEIANSIAKLEPLAEYESYGDIAAELTVILWQVEHVYQSERIKLGNLF